MDDGKKLTVAVIGELRAGKSTVLLSMAQHLHKHNYQITVPTQLVGLGINDTTLNVAECENTEITFVEYVPDWCRCEGAGTCLGCLIEQTVQKEYGTVGLGYLKDNLLQKTVGTPSTQVETTQG